MRYEKATEATPLYLHLREIKLSSIEVPPALLKMSKAENTEI
jgi:hypothetical protein